MHSNFECNLYVHQAKIRPTIGKYAACNAKLLATLTNLQGMTSTKMDSFSPLWNEVIMFNSLSLPGEPLSYKLNPPKISLDLFDKDVHIGCCLLKPFVKLFDNKAINSEAHSLNEINSENTENTAEFFNRKSLKINENISAIKMNSESPRALEWITLSKHGHYVGNLLISAELIQVKG